MVKLLPHWLSGRIHNKRVNTPKRGTPQSSPTGRKCSCYIRTVSTTQTNDISSIFVQKMPNKLLPFRESPANNAPCSRYQNLAFRPRSPGYSFTHAEVNDTKLGTTSPPSHRLFPVLLPHFLRANSVVSGNTHVSGHAPAERAYTNAVQNTGPDNETVPIS